MNTSEAISIVKGRLSDCSRDEVLKAWQHLVNEGTVWGMGAWFSSMASCMIEAGTIERNAA